MVLHSYPALWLYVMDMDVHHAVHQAVAATVEDADPSSFLDSIERERRRNPLSHSWYRWFSLNEGIRSDGTPAYFAKENNLSSWIE